MSRRLIQYQRRLICLSLLWSDGSFEERCVLPDVALPLGGHVCFDEYRRNRTDRLTSATIGASRWIYVHLFFIGTALNAINRANVNACQLFCADTRLADNVGQNF